ncbi:MAG TPA: hypothetical protein VF817_01315 [Patescibacteria group bacterium]
MKNKVLIIRSQNNTDSLEEEINEAIAQANGEGWSVMSVETESVPFGERTDEDYGLMPRHFFYTTTILLGKECI